MSGIRCLLVSEKLEVIKIPVPKEGVYKAVPKMSGELVLEVILIYETYNRKPERLLDVSFDRIQLDKDGGYELNQEEMSRRTRNVVLFGFQTPESLSESKQPISIPTAITIPTKLEKKALIEYLKEKLPKLYSHGVYVIEKEIQSRIKANNDNLKLVKDASRLKDKKD